MVNTWSKNGGQTLNVPSIKMCGELKRIASWSWLANVSTLFPRMSVSVKRNSCPPRVWLYFSEMLKSDDDGRAGVVSRRIRAREGSERQSKQWNEWKRERLTSVSGQWSQGQGNRTKIRSGKLLIVDSCNRCSLLHHAIFDFLFESEKLNSFRSGEMDIMLAFHCFVHIVVVCLDRNCTWANFTSPVFDMLMLLIEIEDEAVAQEHWFASWRHAEFEHGWCSHDEEQIRVYVYRWASVWVNEKTKEKSRKQQDVSNV